MSKSKVHRGRSKQDTQKVLSIRLTEEEYEKLKTAAEVELRTAPAQALWFILKGINHV